MKERGESDFFISQVIRWIELGEPGRAGGAGTGMGREGLSGEVSSILDEMLWCPGWLLRI